jgi:hypothetical protein
VKHFGNLPEKKPAGHSFPPVVGIGEVIANIPEVGGTQQGIADGVDEDIRVGVTYGTLRGYKLYPAKKKVTSLRKGVNIEPQAYS